MRKLDAKQLAGFLVPSIVGIMLFMIPIQVNGSWTVAVKVLADVIGNALGDSLPFLCVIIVTVSAVLGLVSLAKPSFITSYPIVDSTFSSTPIWAIIRCIGAVFAWLTFLGVGTEDEGACSIWSQALTQAASCSTTC